MNRVVAIPIMYRFKQGAGRKLANLLRPKRPEGAVFVDEPDSTHAGPQSCS